MRVAFEVLRRRTDSFIADAVIFEIAPLVLTRAVPSGLFGYDKPLSSRDMEAFGDLRQETKEEDDDAQTAHLSP